jgi:hypothetical protein
MTDTAQPIAPPVARRNLWLTSIDQAIGEVKRLREGGYTRRGTWSLPQICRHLRMTIDDNLQPPPTDVPTADELAAREKFFSMAMNPAGMPAGLPLPPERAPAADTADDEVDKFVASLKSLQTCGHKCIKIGRCGPVPLDQVIALHLAHTSHHLSFLEPNGKPTRVRFKTDAELKAEVEHLRKHPHERTGNWTLPQIARHLTRAIESGLQTPVESTVPTPEQTAAKAAEFDHYITNGKAPAGFDAPPELLPGDDCNDGDVDQFLSAVNRLMTDDRPYLAIGGYGPIPMDECRAFHLAHAGHHLSFLKSKRRKLRYADEAAVIADVNELRRGYRQHGTWTLPQICWHLAAGVRSRMAPCPNPMPANTPEQDALRPMFEKVMAAGELPSGLPAPDRMMPPADPGDAAIDDFIAAMKQFAAFPGPIAPHARFGNLPDAEARRLNLIHCAHHLSHLEPTNAKPAGYRAVRYPDAAAALADIALLRRGYRQLGNWNLPMITRHIGFMMGRGMTPPADPTPTPEQAARKRAFIDVLLTTGNPPPGTTAPPQAVPAADCGDADIDRLCHLLAAMEKYPHPIVEMGPFGPVPTAEYRAVQLGHLARHLGFLVPAGNGS